MSDIRLALAHVVWNDIDPGCHNDTTRLISSGLVKSYVCVEGTLLPMGRNEALRQIVSDKKSNYTHVLFVDGDMRGLTPQMVQRLLAWDKDIVGALCTRRSAPFLPVSVPLEDDTLNLLLKEMDKPNPGLVECVHTGTGCMLITREVIETLAENVLRPENLPGGIRQDVVWFTMDRGERHTINDEFKALVLRVLEHEWPEDKDDVDIIAAAMREAYMLGRTAHQGTAIIGEDVGFCHRAREAGFRVFVDCGVLVEHVGRQSYTMRDMLAHKKRSDSMQLALSSFNHGIETPDLEFAA